MSNVAGAQPALALVAALTHPAQHQHPKKGFPGAKCPSQAGWATKISVSISQLNQEY